MPDIASITAAISGVKTATEIAKWFRESDLTFEKAEAKLKVAELMNALADAKMSIVETQELVDERDKEIKELREALDAKKKIVLMHGVYREVDEAGTPTGDNPYCLRCWEVDHKQVHIVLNYYNSIWVCPQCKTTVRR